MKGRVYLLLDVDDDEPWTDTGWTDKEKGEAPEDPQISLNALIGVSLPQTMRTPLKIKGMKATALIDSGSTHNLINPKVARFLKIPVTEGKRFKVKVANGESMESTGQCQVVCQFPAIMMPVEFLLLKIGRL